ncbi:hypothetical protein V8E36_000719 [Tilletia maclaganii]
MQLPTSILVLLAPSVLAASLPSNRLDLGSTQPPPPLLQPHTLRALSPRGDSNTAAGEDGTDTALPPSDQDPLSVQLCTIYTKDVCADAPLLSNQVMMSRLAALNHCMCQLWARGQLHDECPHPHVHCRCYKGCVADVSQPVWGKADPGGYCVMACKQCRENPEVPHC